MTRSDLFWRSHPLDRNGRMACFETAKIYCSIAFTRWTNGFQVYWRYLDEPHGHYVTIPEVTEMDDWLRQLGEVSDSELKLIGAAG